MQQYCLGKTYDTYQSLSRQGNNTTPIIDQNK